MTVLLALDVATTTGFAYGEIGEKPLSNAIDFRTLEIKALDKEIRQDDDKDRNTWVNDSIWKEGEAWLFQQIKVIRPNIVAIEAPIRTASNGQTSPATLERLIGLQAIFRKVIHQMTPAHAIVISVQTVRKSFIGHGNLKGEVAKKLVRSRCLELGWITEDVASLDRTDALAVWGAVAATKGDIRGKWIGKGVYAPMPKAPALDDMRF